MRSFMIKDYYTVEQVSSMLNIHPKTIQRYIREGKLRACKIGKGWHITGHDLSDFTESNSNAKHYEKPNAERALVASSVIDITAYGKEEAIRYCQHKSQNRLARAHTKRVPGWRRLLPNHRN
ncbi:MAG: DNA-binding protein [Clostridia bacterium]|nr:DNA-binding protein [Clostridia bacterium]